jgi:NADH-quinone oxidoreductase subunit J
MAEAIAFYTLAAFILGLGVMVITARSAVHCVLFLVANFLFVAALYVLLGAQFLAVIQVLVYAGGIVVLYLFVVMLVNLRRPAEAFRAPHRQSGLGLTVALVLLAEIGLITAFGFTRPAAVGTTSGPLAVHNVEQLGWALYADYLIPFEIASILLLVAMIGAIVLARREL